MVLQINYAIVKYVIINLVKIIQILKTIADKTDRILKHFKNCQNFQDLYSQQEKDEVFKSKEESHLGKRISK